MSIGVRAGASLFPTGPALTVVGVLLLTIVPFIPCADGLASLRTHGVVLALMVGTVVLGLAARSGDATHVALIACLYLAAYCTPGVRRLWPMPLPVVLAGYAALVFAFPMLRETVRFWERGTIDRASATCMAAFTVAAAVALVAWRYASGIDMSAYRSFVPTGIPPWLVFAGAVPFAMLNAAFEELVWRGVLWQGCEAGFGAKAALVITSVSFGLAHYRGFPSGAVGVALATIYGAMMGLLRMRTGGLLGPWIAHVFADVVIYEMVAAMVLA
jgi:membrane protease YdiL (CAAX protease family)